MLFEQSAADGAQFAGNSCCCRDRCMIADDQAEKTRNGAAPPRRNIVTHDRERHRRLAHLNRGLHCESPQSVVNLSPDSLALASGLPLVLRHPARRWPEAWGSGRRHLGRRREHQDRSDHEVPDPDHRHRCRRRRHGHVTQGPEELLRRLLADDSGSPGLRPASRRDFWLGRRRGRPPRRVLRAGGDQVFSAPPGTVLPARSPRRHPPPNRAGSCSPSWPSSSRRRLEEFLFGAILLSGS